MKNDNARMERYNIISGDESKAKIVSIMKNTDLGRLALFDEKYPYIIPMNHTFYQDSLIFHGSFTGIKVDLMRKNKFATYEIDYCVDEKKDHVENCHLQFESAILFGEIAPVEDREKRLEYFNAILTAYNRGIIKHSDGSVDSCYAFIFKIHKASARDGRFHPHFENKLYLYDFAEACSHSGC